MQTHIDTTLVSSCGLYCGECKKFKAGSCNGCHTKEPPQWCKVKPCTESKEIHDCSCCNEFSDIKQCNKMYPLSYKFGEFITGMSRALGIKIIKEYGVEAFANFMVEVNHSLCVKTRKFKNALKNKWFKR